ncbi:MAG: hypothetical protein JWP81_1189 [Ferruginibacter sp.]|nr:hypothetical protein [Ferruginibacter sp.]
MLPQQMIRISFYLYLDMGFKHEGIEGIADTYSSISFYYLRGSISQAIVLLQEEGKSGQQRATHRLTAGPGDTGR